MTQFDMHKLAIAKTSAAKNKAPDIMLNLSIFSEFHPIPPSRKSQHPYCHKHNIA